MPRKINPCGKTRPVSSPYEIWLTSDLKWRWLVLKKYRNEVLSFSFRMLGWDELCFECAERMKKFGEPFLHNKKIHSAEDDYICIRCGRKLVDVQPSKNTLIQLGIKL